MKTKIEDFELSFFEGVVNRRPDYIDALVPLAHAYTRLGLYEKGLEIDKRLAGLCKKDPVVHYNLACSYALSGKARQSFAALKKAVKLGFRDYRHIAKDQDLKILRDYEPFSKWYKKTTTVRTSVSSGD
ncbi:MAG: hypothetical protein BWY42_01071 [Candidatus Omnitrophica bacterium ADurb.Bin277]|nr:MAG: hypothetical protein BWY42_01071 [Candidatus Omnitrophica bacterium ADurb.Bin277]